MIEKFISPGDKPELRTTVRVTLPDGTEGIKTYRLPPSPSLHQRGIPGVFQLLRRTRPQCLKLLMRKMMKDKS